MRHRSLFCLARVWLAVLLAVLFAASLTACAGDRDESADGQLGRWNAAPNATQQPALSAKQLEQQEQLQSIGYVGGSVKSTRSGVTINNTSAEAGLNFFTSGHAPVALLMNMEGRILHEWRFAFSKAWPDSKDWDREHANWWRRAYLYENGDVLAIFEGLGIIRIDRDSNLLWANSIKAHHDIEVMPDESIWILSREIHARPEKNDLIFEDFLSLLSPGGKLQRKISVLEALRKSPYAGLLEDGKRSSGDILHTNTLHVLQGDFEPSIPAFRAGQVLTSMNALGVIAVLDPDTETMTWARRGQWRSVGAFGQHDPQVLANGHMLYFKNNAPFPRSRVREVDIATDQEVWSYSGSKSAPFYSPTCGAVQRLANHNTLITETDSGRAFEVDPDGHTVWEYFNPFRAGKNSEFIASVSEMKRLPLDYTDSWRGQTLSQ